MYSHAFGDSRRLSERGVIMFLEFVVLGTLFLAPPIIQKNMDDGNLPTYVRPECKVELVKHPTHNYYTQKVVDDGECQYINFSLTALT